MFDTSFYVSDDEPENYASLVESNVDEMIQNNNALAITTYKDQEVKRFSCLVIYISLFTKT